MLALIYTSQQKKGIFWFVGRYCSISFTTKNISNMFSVLFILSASNPMTGLHVTGKVSFLTKWFSTHRAEEAYFVMNILFVSTSIGSPRKHFTTHITDIFSICITRCRNLKKLVEVLKQGNNTYQILADRVKYCVKLYVTIIIVFYAPTEYTWLNFTICKSSNTVNVHGYFTSQG